MYFEHAVIPQAAAAAVSASDAGIRQPHRVSRVGDTVSVWHKACPCLHSTSMAPTDAGICYVTYDMICELHRLSRLGEYILMCKARLCSQATLAPEGHEDYKKCP